MSLLSYFSFGKQKILNEGIRRLNFLAAALHALQGVLILVFSSTGGVRPITTSFLTQDQLASQSGGQPILVQATHHLFDLNLAYVVAAFFFINAIAHLLAATRLRRKFEEGLKNGVNRVRWIDFAISSGVMMTAVALVVGIYDISSLLMIFGLTALMGLTTALIEINKPVQLNYWLGIFAGVLAWLVVILYTWGAHVWGTALPAYAYAVAISLLLLFAAIAANFYLQYKKLGHWENYVFGERVYIILSFAAKTILGWLIFAGTLR
ncbi:MAG: putative rane protein [Candidatus Saccharibacteria bacterium]|nr:putative rane protein [Candidatus Saccharibacteria bacterium]